VHAHKHHFQNALVFISPSPSGAVCGDHSIDSCHLTCLFSDLLIAMLSVPVVSIHHHLYFAGPFILFSAPGIRALESIPPSDFLSFEDAFCSNIIVDSAVLADAITDIEWWGEEVSLSMSASEPIQFETCCAHGRCSIRMSSSSDVFSRVSIHPSSPSCSYKVHLLKQFSKSLSLSNRTGITLSSKGWPAFAPSLNIFFLESPLLTLQACFVLQ
jgi:hypothetical protein